MTAKAGLSKKDLTMSRLELEPMHMAANLCQNIKSNLKGKPIWIISLDGPSVPLRYIGLETKNSLWTTEWKRYKRRLFSSSGMLQQKKIWHALHK